MQERKMKIFLIYFLFHFWSFTIILQAIRIGPIIKNALRREISDGNNISLRDGYEIENHEVITKDGYILRLDRVLPKKSANDCMNQLTPVYLFHGLLGNSETWLITGPGRSLGYLFSDEGYDVWIGNARGSTYSRRHRFLDPNEKKFWEFTWHEIGIYDNPANIDYILNKTKQEKLHYIGHSQGTTTFFVMTSMFPEYNNKIKTMHALAPVAFMKYATSPFMTLLAPYVPIYSQLVNIFGLEESLPNTHFSAIAQKFCKTRDLNLNLCYKILAVGVGMNPKQIDTDTLYKFFDLAPAGASIYQILHYIQLFFNGKFQSYDYGRKKNLRRYNQSHPTVYPLHRVTTNSIHLYVSGNDLFSNIKDVKTLISKLPKTPFILRVADKEWNHLDYIIGKDAKELVYDKIMKDIREADKLIICGKT